MSNSANAASDYPHKMHFHDVIRESDTSVGEILSIAQDAEGYMWFGGRRGVLRYDGYEFVEYPVIEDLAEPQQVRSAHWATSLLVDHNGALWLGRHGGLFRLDRNQKVFTPIAPQQTALANINDLLQLPSGEILVASYDGLSLLDTDGAYLAHLPFIGGSEQSPLDSRINTVGLTSAGDIWVGSQKGLSLLTWPAKKWQHFILNPEDPDSIQENAVLSLDVDPIGNVWMGTAEGLYRFSPTEQHLVRYRHDANQSNSLNHNYIHRVFVDSLARVWAGSDAEGLSVYRPESDDFINYKNSGEKRANLSYNIVRVIFEDSAGDLWVSTYPGGINYYDQTTQAIELHQSNDEAEQSLLDNRISAISDDGRGGYWVVSGDGISNVNAERDHFTHFLHAQNDESKAPLDSLITISRGRDGQYWFGSWAQSFFYYDEGLNYFVQMPYSPELLGQGIKDSSALIAKTVWHIHEDKDGLLWLSTHEGGLVRYDRVSKTFRHYVVDYNNSTSITSSMVWRTMEDSKGRFWVATVQGLNLMDKGSETFSVLRGSSGELLEDDNISDIFEDSQQNIWVATENGLYVLDESSQTFRHFSEGDGLVSNGVRRISEDNAGYLWIATDEGISRLDGQRKNFKNFRRFNNENIGSVRTIYKAPNNEMMFGGVNGWRIFDLDKLDAASQPPKASFTDFKILNKSVAPNDDSGALTDAIENAAAVNLSYHVPMFSFHFSALSFRDSDENQYAYMLEGFDRDWHHVGTERRAQYTNLPAGRYQFKVKSKNRDGIWSDEVLSIDVVQRPAPWRTWWAYCIYVFSALMVVALIVRYQINKRKDIERQNQWLELKVKARTADLHLKNQEVQSLLESMQQGLFAITQQLTVASGYSAQLENIFERTDLAGDDAATLLFDRSDVYPDVRAQAEETLKTLLGEDELFFSLNGHLLPDDFSVDIDGCHKHLSVHWNPIFRNGLITKVMVSVRDITLLKRVEDEARSKNRELDIVAQLLHVKPEKFSAFLSGCRELVHKTKRQLAEACNPESALSHMLINVHTIKGNARMLGLVQLSDFAHEVEDRCSLQNSSLGISGLGRLNDNVQELEGCIDEYARIYHETLGHKNQEPSSGFWLKAGHLERLQAVVQRLQGGNEAPQSAAAADQIQQVLDQGLSATFASTIADALCSLRVLARQLKKENPHIELQNADWRVRQDFQELINNIFIHLLRNSLDHGIETADERRGLGKAEQGIITINLAPDSSVVHIHYADDGRGLALVSLYEQGVELGVWPDTPTCLDVAQLIFGSGVTTKTQVTTVSGRGVGLDAVQKFAREAGGWVSLNVEGGDKSFSKDISLAPFELVIALPKSVFVEPVARDK